MLRIGLTGGIGSGKTTVARYFAELGVAIIDADVIAREVVKPHSPVFKKIVEHFGDIVIEKNGNLNRQKLRKLVFNNINERQWLERALHPLIRKRMKEEIAKVKSSYCILVIPLLIENLPHPLVDHILLVDTPQELQQHRVKERDKLRPNQLQAILEAQTNRQQRLAAADDVIHNDKGLPELHQAVVELHTKYLKLVE